MWGYAYFKRIACWWKNGLGRRAKCKNCGFELKGLVSRKGIIEPSLSGKKDGNKVGTSDSESLQSPGNATESVTGQISINDFVDSDDISDQFFNAFT